MDVTIIISSCVLLAYLIIGVYPSKNKGTESFLIANRKLNSLSNGFSIAASKIGAGLLITYSIFFFSFGWSAFFYFIGIVIGYIVFFRFAKKLKNEADENQYYTLADYFRHRYGLVAGKTLGVITVLSVFGWVLTNLVAGGQLLTELTNIPILTTTFTLAIIIGLYLFIGGFNSVVRTDKIQYGALLIIFVVFGFVLITRTDNLFDVVYIDESIPYLKIVGFILLGVFFPMGSAELWQRVYASKNVKELRGSMVTAGISYVVLGIFVSLICLVVMSKGGVSGIDGELKLAIGVKNILGGISPVLTGIWIIAFISAIISSADTFVYTASSSLIQDLLCSSKTKKETIVNRVKFAIVSFLAVGTVISILYPDVKGLTIMFVGISLVISGAVYMTLIKKVKYSNVIVMISTILGTVSVIGHFIISRGESEVVTTLIGLIVVCLIMGVSPLFYRLINNS